MWSDILINILEDGAFAAMAAIGFSSISNTPHRAYMTCALIAAAGHSIRYMLTLPELGAMHIIPASTAASFAIGMLAVLFASRIKCPAEVFQLLFVFSGFCLKPFPYLFLKNPPDFFVGDHKLRHAVLILPALGQVACGKKDAP